MAPPTGASPIIDRRPGSPPWARLEHNGSLDGLRAIAVLLVVFFHAGLPWLPAGFIGVDVFFVLSGFLITSLIVREVWSTRKLDIIGFWARRARRLLPMALLVLLVTAIVYSFVAPAIDVANNRSSFPAAALYVSNWVFADQAVDYFATDAAKSPVLHYWSLSIEEQFYLVWPFIALLVFLMAFRRVRHAVTAVSVLVIASLGYAILLSASNPEGAYFNTFARVWQLLAGALIALAVLGPRLRSTPLPPVLRAGAAVIAPIAVVGIIVSASSLLGDRPTLVSALLATGSAAALIASVWMFPGVAVARWLAAAPMQLIGRWSYGIYLWHWPIIVIGELGGWLSDSWWINVPVVTISATGLAAITYVLVERPTRALSLKPRRRAVIVLVSLLAAAGVTAAATWTYLRPPAAIAGVIEQLDRDLQKEAIGERTAGATSGAKVLLVGDSHAGFWQPALAALAEKQGWQLRSVAREACPWALVDALAPRQTTTLPCAEALTGPALQIAEAFRPDITILVSRSIQRQRLLSPDGAELKVGTEAWWAEMSSGAALFVDELLEFSGEVVLIEPTPETLKPMVRCVTKGDDENCDREVSHLRTFDTVVAFYRELAAANPRVHSVSFEELICPGGICPALVGDILTFRDTHHLTTDYAALLIEDVDAILREQSIFLSGSASSSRSEE